jgi:hypothetical protein
MAADRPEEGTALDEQTWLSCHEPQEMLLFLRNSGRASGRRCRLFAVACCRALWPLLDRKPYRYAVDLAERFCDGRAAAAQLAAAETDTRKRTILDGRGGVGPLWEAGWYADPAGGARGNATHPDAPAVPALAAAMADAQGGAELCIPWATALGIEPTLQTALFRDLFGPLPFRAVAFDPAWRTPTVVALAQRAYLERQLPEGTLDARLLAVLADAVEEAGCNNEEVLSHLRQEGAVRVRGCWAVDAVLATE